MFLTFSFLPIIIGVHLFARVIVTELANEIIKEVACLIIMRVVLILILQLILLVEIGFHESV